jgi:hypothetical protein
VDGTLFDVVDEANVVGWMPVEGVKDRVKLYRVD